MIAQAEMKRSDISLNWGNQLFFQVLDNIQDIFILVDKTGKVAYVNKAYTETLSILPEKIIGKNLYQIEPDALVLKVLERKKPIHNQVDYVKSLKIDAIGVSFPVYDDQGEVIGAASVFSNVSRLVKLTQELQKTREMAAYLQEQLKDSKLPMEFKEYITQSHTLKEILNLAAKVARTDSTVLIRGESGVGKEVIAKIIHHASQRKNQPLIKVNCASIPENLIESELFGYEEGAYTGAKRGGKMGKFELANDGTIFLDEVGDMSLNMQAKLLRVIQEREMERVGGVKSISLNVRIIAATNRNLEKMIEENTFRSDLYYRLNVVPLNIPPLRERKEDIMPLVRNYVEKMAGGQEIDMEPRAIKVLQTYDWPGNIRELHNVLEHALIVRTGPDIETKDLPQYLRENVVGEEEADAASTLNMKNAVQLLEKELMIKALKGCGWNKTAAMSELGISRRSFYEKMEKYELLKKKNPTHRG